MTDVSPHGVLYVAATPIGNLEDMTFRVRDVLEECDLVLAEDTRHSKKLLTHYGLKKRMLSYHEHNESHRTPQIIDLIKAKKKIVLISDAGTPGIADPGNRLVRQVLLQGLPVSVLPGPSALAAALSVCGLPGTEHCFLGFLPRTRKERLAILRKAKTTGWRTVFFEAPHRVSATMTDVLEIWGPDHEIFLAREMSKKFEELVLTRVGTLYERVAEHGPQGECVFVVGASDTSPVAGKAGINDGTSDVEHDMEHVLGQAITEVTELVERGMQRSQAVRYVAERRKVSKNALYRAVMSPRESGSEA